MSRLVQFYRGDDTDTERRRLGEILDWSDADFEDVHDFVQWLFPLPAPSRFNSDAPLLTADDITAFKQDPVLQANLHRALTRMFAFLGLTLSEGVVVEGQNFKARVGDVWAHPNHNWLRITRILRSLTLLGKRNEAIALYQWLETMERSRRFSIPADTFQYWTAAIQE